MAKARPEWEPIWRRALAEEFGMKVGVGGNPTLVMQELYATRAAMADPALDTLRICCMKDGSLWIVKQDVDLKEVEMPDANRLD